MKTEENKIRVVTIEKYLSEGRMNRIVIKSFSERYFLDLPVKSFSSRLFLLSAISLIQVYSLLLHNVKVAIIKFTTDSLI